MTSCAWARESGLEVRYGILTATTFSGPRAWADRNAVTAESTPPERPSTAFLKSRRSNSSRRNETSQPAVSWGSIPSGGGPPGESGVLITGIGSVPFLFEVFALGFETDFLLTGATALRDFRLGARAVSSVDGASARSPSARLPTGVSGPPSAGASS